ncbi:MAG: hypothetical protein HY744_10740 [Deltaproteobacteria bacterium]|nr:hypothetical protein [Deltaproteobacteria bacterium]
MAGVRSAVLLAAVLLGVGCHLIGGITDLKVGEQPGTSATGGASAGGGGATGAGAGGGAGGSGAAGGGGGGAVGGGGGGGGAECSAPEECPGEDTTCRYRICQGGTCGFEDAVAGTPCSEGGGVKCDGQGACVQCVGPKDCTADEFCGAGKCEAKKAEGQSCVAPQECLSSFCAQGTCCNAGCGGPCESCALNGSEGKCLILPLGEAGSPSCSPYVCDGKSENCPSGCGDVTLCVPGFECTGGKCVGKKPNGEGCAGPDECQSGFCADAVCCDKACDKSCEACAAAKSGGSDGACGFVPQGKDPDGECPQQQICDGKGGCADPCPASASPPGDPNCPKVCTGKCKNNNSICVIDCTSPACTGKPVNCPANFACEILCEGAKSCQASSITCPDTYPCQVSCGVQGEAQSCQSAMISCGQNAPCKLACGGGSQVCKDAKLVCSEQACMATCQSPGDQPTVVCAKSCGCQGC